MTRKVFHLETFPRFQATLEVKCKLGEGCFGTVFLCRQNSVLFAIKVAALPQREAETHRQLDEAETLCSLVHPNIIKTLTFWTEKVGADHFACIQMEYMEGGSLRKIIDERYFARSRRDTKEVWTVIRHVLTGLAYLHEKGYIHRDIKPENILLANGCAKIADFGLVTHVQRTKMSIRAATERYMAPEVLFENYDALVDIYRAFDDTMIDIDRSDGRRNTKGCFSMEFVKIDKLISQLEEGDLVEFENRWRLDCFVGCLSLSLANIIQHSCMLPVYCQIMDPSSLLSFGVYVGYATPENVPCVVKVKIRRKWRRFAAKCEIILVPLTKAAKGRLVRIRNERDKTLQPQEPEVIVSQARSYVGEIHRLEEIGSEELFAYHCRYNKVVNPSTTIRVRAQLIILVALAVIFAVQTILILNNLPSWHGN